MEEMVLFSYAQADLDLHNLNKASITADKESIEISIFHISTKHTYYCVALTNCLTLSTHNTSFH